MGTRTSIDGHLLGWFVSSCFAYVFGFVISTAWASQNEGQKMKRMAIWGLRGLLAYGSKIRYENEGHGHPGKSCTELLINHQLSPGPLGKPVQKAWWWLILGSSEGVLPHRSGLLVDGTNFDDLLGRFTSPRETGCLGSGPEDGLNRGKCPKIMFKIQHACLSSCGVFAAGRNFTLALGYMFVVPPELAAVM